MARKGRKLRKSASQKRTCEEYGTSASVECLPTPRARSAGLLQHCMQILAVLNLVLFHRILLLQGTESIVDLDVLTALTRNERLHVGRRLQQRLEVAVLPNLRL